MPTYKYWRVVMKKSRKAHLTFNVEDRFGPAEFALCGRPLDIDSRREPPRTIPEPLGNECDGCRIVSGHLKRPPRPKPTEEQRRMMVFYGRALKQRDLLQKLGLSKEAVVDIMRNLGSPTM
jgi:hypothetical protein